MPEVNSAVDFAPTYTVHEILKLLPHRFPFLLVDRVDTIIRPEGGTRVGTKVRAVKNVTFNEPYFPGHFPHRPVMPGVLQIEAMAQVAALGVVLLDGPRLDVAIAAVDNARFRRPVVPGDTLDIEAEILKERSGIIQVRCVARVRGQVAAECEVMAKVFPLEESQH